MRRSTGYLVSMAIVWGATPQAWAAQRDLSRFSERGVPFTVTITLDTPSGTNVAGVEETPPVDWSVANISDGGTVDAQTGKIKWGPFFDPSIPAEVTYETTSLDEAGRFCFTGTVSFDGPPAPIGGDECLLVGVPTVSVWGLIVLGLLIAVSGSVVAGKVAHPKYSVALGNKGLMA